MRELGERLRQARLQRQLTLADLQVRTRIRTRYLEAIEEGNLHTLPGNVYAKGFLRLYAEQVGLDPQEVLSEYEARLKEQPADLWDRPGWRPLGHGTPTPLARSGFILSRVSPGEERRRRALRLAALVLAVLFVPVVTVFLVSWPDEEQRVIEQMAADPLSVLDPVLLSSPGPAAEREPAGVVLRAVALESSWVEVYADGRQVFQGVLRQGEDVTWEAAEVLRVSVGRASDVELYLNGERVGAAGDGVVTREFRRTDHEIPGGDEE